MAIAWFTGYGSLNQRDSSCYLVSLGINAKFACHLTHYRRYDDSFSSAATRVKFKRTHGVCRVVTLVSINISMLRNTNIYTGKILKKYLVYLGTITKLLLIYINKRIGINKNNYQSCKQSIN